jgi:hypothetical protein
VASIPTRILTDCSFSATQSKILSVPVIFCLPFPISLVEAETLVFTNLASRRFEMFTHRYPTQYVISAAEIAWMLTAAVAALGFLLPIGAKAQEGILHSFDYPTFSFTGCPPGSGNPYPTAGLLYHKGHLYGTTPEGGSGAKNVPDSDDGMVFKLTAPETFLAPPNGAGAPAQE